MSMKTILWAAAAAALVWWIIRRLALYPYEVRKATGVQAAIDAGIMNGYTTYNTSLYTPPLFQPLVRFFKAGAYVPPSTGTQQQSDAAAYSMQG